MFSSFFCCLVRGICHRCNGDLTATRLPTSASGREEKNMSAIASTWLGDNNRMELQDDGGGDWAALEMKGGRWAAAFGHTAGKQQGPTRKRKQGSSDKGLADDSNNGDAANKGGEGSSDSRGGMKRAGRRQE
ncbi:hypothetical protein GW17_00010379 [Ensete ventricosum]|nr:hypothetical protein GW17_00010379 [Ensete ventricosum]